MDDGNVRVSQLLSILIIIAAIVLIYYRRSLVPPTALYSDPLISTKAPVSVVNEDTQDEEAIIETEPEMTSLSDETEQQLKE